MVIGFAVAAGVVIAVVQTGAGEPTSFRRLTVVNPTPYIVNVEVTGAERDGWLDVGTFRREGRRTVEELADQGSAWVFGFSYAGIAAGELVASRAQLVADDWVVTVPSEVAERLRSEGVPESAR